MRTPISKRRYDGGTTEVSWHDNGQWRYYPKNSENPFALVGTGQAKSLLGKWSWMIGQAGGIRWETRRRDRPRLDHPNSLSTFVMRAIWKGSISFGLVSIPIELFPATRREELTFRLLRGSDLSPVNYKRVAEADGKEVPWDQIVKGYEYEKGKYVVLRDEDFARVDVEATQTVDIVQFVQLKEINPCSSTSRITWKCKRAGTKPIACYARASPIRARSRSPRWS